MKTKTKHVRPYTTKTGLSQFRPSIQLVMAMQANDEGFCLACGETQGNCEPDAKKYTCDSCGKPKVFGSEELVLMGLTFEA